MICPLHFCQIMHHFSQKNVAITNVLVFTFIYFVCIGKTQKIWGKKAKSDIIPHRKRKMDWTKLFAHLIFGITPFGKNNRPLWRGPSPNCCLEICPQVFYGIKLNLILWRPHFVFCKQYNNVLHHKAQLWSHLSTWRSPRRILASSGKFWHTLVWLFYVSVLTVGSSWVSYHSVPFHSDGDG